MSAEPVVADLARHGLTLGVAESVTGGALADFFIRVPGASAVVRGGIVAYATDLKRELLGVDGDLLATAGPVDPRVAHAMAAGVRHVTGADVGLATTGVAGPAQQGGQPVGTVYIAVVTPGATAVRGWRLSGDRAALRQASVRLAAALVRSALTE